MRYMYLRKWLERRFLFYTIKRLRCKAPSQIQYRRHSLPVTSYLRSKNPHRRRRHRPLAHRSFFSSFPVVSAACLPRSIRFVGKASRVGGGGGVGKRILRNDTITPPGPGWVPAKFMVSPLVVDGSRLMRTKRRSSWCL